MKQTFFIADLPSSHSVDSSFACANILQYFALNPSTSSVENSYSKLRNHFRCSTMTKGDTVLFTYTVAHGMKHLA